MSTTPYPLQFPPSALAWSPAIPKIPKKSCKSCFRPRKTPPPFAPVDRAAPSGENGRIKSATYTLRPQPTGVIPLSRFANISLVNFPTLPPDEPGRLQKTLDRMCGYIAEAAQEQSDLVAFPEICNCLETADPSNAPSLSTGRPSSRSPRPPASMSSTLSPRSCSTMPAAATTAPCSSAAKAKSSVSTAKTSHPQRAGQRHHPRRRNTRLRDRLRPRRALHLLRSQLLGGRLRPLPQPRRTGDLALHVGRWAHVEQMGDGVWL